MNDDSDSDGEAARSSGEPFAEDGLALVLGGCRAASTDGAV